MRLGNSFNVDTQALRIKSFEYGGHTFRVKVPTLAEHEALLMKIEDVKDNQTALEEIYAKRTMGLEASESVVFQDNDVIVEGRSMREAAKNELMSQAQITGFFNLLVKEVDDGLGDLTYQDINDELPLSVQLELMKRIADAVSPNLDDAKKN